MADQHIGYPGSVGSSALANWLTNMVAQYSVEGPNDCKVVITAGDRAIQVKAGTIIGDGIMDVFENATPLTLGTISSGDRWDMVVLRRTWSATPGASTSVFTVIPGNANRALPTRTNNKGVVTDQPVALCRVRAGQTAVQEVVDLRVWAHNGGAFAVDELVKDYLTEAGTDIVINTTRWIRGVVASPTNNSLSWYSPDQAGPWVMGTYYNGWRTVTNGTPYMVRNIGNNMAHVVGECVYEGQLPSPSGLIEGWSPGRLPAGFESKQTIFIGGVSGGYRRTQVFYVAGNEVRCGPFPEGNIIMFNGIYPLN